MNINRPWSSVVGVHSSYQGLETSSRDQGLLSWMHTHTQPKRQLLLQRTYCGHSKPDSALQKQSKWGINPGKPE